MSESHLTKKALAQALKELAGDKPFEKIAVKDICDACGVSRKTFYYHFGDKYALMEWIFDTECSKLFAKSGAEDLWSKVQTLCQYFYDNRVFYNNLLQFQGQNAFRYHFQESLFEIMEKYLLPEREAIDMVAERNHEWPENILKFYSRFLADAMMGSVYRWLHEGAKQSPEEFVALLRSTDELIRIKMREPEETGIKENKSE